MACTSLYTIFQCVVNSGRFFFPIFLNIVCVVSSSADNASVQTSSPVFAGCQQRGFILCMKLSTFCVGWFLSEVYFAEC